MHIMAGAPYPAKRVMTVTHVLHSPALFGMGIGMLCSISLNSVLDVSNSEALGILGISVSSYSFQVVFLMSK